MRMDSFGLFPMLSQNICFAPSFICEGGCWWNRCLHLFLYLCKCLPPTNLPHKALHQGWFWQNKQIKEENKQNIKNKQFVVQYFSCRWVLLCCGILASFSIQTDLYHFWKANANTWNVERVEMLGAVCYPVNRHMAGWAALTVCLPTSKVSKNSRVDGRAPLASGKLLKFPQMWISNGNMNWTNLR